MDNLNDIINNLSDDDINMLKSVASSILDGEAKKNNTDSDHKRLAGSGGQNNTESVAAQNGLDNIDFDMIMKAKNIFDKMNSTNSKNADLILALKPHLSPETRDKADRAVRILKLFDILPFLKELF